MSFRKVFVFMFLILLTSEICSKSLLRSKSTTKFDCTKKDGEPCTEFDGKTGYCIYDPHVGDNYCAVNIPGYYSSTTRR